MEVQFVSCQQCAFVCVCVLGTKGVAANLLTTGCLISPGDQARGTPGWEEKACSGFAA